MGFDASYVSHIEAGRHKPTQDFAKRADTALGAGGLVLRRYADYVAAREGPDVRTGAANRDAPPGRSAGHGLIVAAEWAMASLHDDHYRYTIRRALVNTGPTVVTRLPLRVAVDRYPGDPVRSNRYHQTNPLTVEEIDLRAWLTVAGGAPSEPLSWRTTQDRPDFKEFWVLLAGPHAQFPLNPGQRAVVEFAYRVPVGKVGDRFERSVALPTDRLELCVDLPAAARPAVWGSHSSLSAEDVPLGTPITQGRVGERAVFSWATEQPTLHSRVQLQWHLRLPARA
jgi:hypothetical protein